MSVYKTTYRLVVLSEDNPIPDDWSLAELAEAMDTGDCVGTCELRHKSRVSFKRLTSELKKVGNDGYFFSSVGVQDD